MERNIWARGGSAAVALGLTLLVVNGHTQQRPALQATDFKVQLDNYPPPHEAQVKTLLEGATSEITSGLIPVTKAKFSTFSTNGALEILAEAPHCIFDPDRRTVSSSGTLRVKTADGSFSLEGLGFSLQLTNSAQTNFNLILSNQVHTVIRNLRGTKPLKL